MYFKLNSNRTMDNKKKTLFLTDLNQYTEVKMQSTVEYFNNDPDTEEVVYITGKVSDMGVSELNPNLKAIIDVKSTKPWTVVDVKTAKKLFSSFTKKMYDNSPAEVVNAFILEFNLEGRNDLSRLMFTAEEQTNEKLLMKVDLLENQVKTAIEQLVSVRILVSAMLSVMPKETQDIVNAKFQMAQNAMNSSIALSAEFVEFIRTVEDKQQTRRQFVEGYAKSSQLFKEEKLNSLYQNWSKGVDVEDFDAYLDEVVLDIDMIRDQNLLHALAEMI